MVYKWEPHRELCHRLYVEENRSLDDVMRILKEKHNFDPSKRGYQTQFHRWGFPPKHTITKEDEQLTERIRQLWERNTSQKEMLEILRGEGFEISDRGMMRIRSKNGWLLRIPNGLISYAKSRSKRKRDQAHEAQEEQEDTQDTSLGQEERNVIAALRDRGAGTQEITLDNSSIEITDEMREAYRRGVLPPEIEEKRRERLDKLQAWSDQALATKKRRRRTRGWAGLPADPPAPPRFPSETTLDEGKAILRMENTLYQDIRKQFQTICEEAGFLKKTEAGPERWQGAKDRLVAESLHLDRQFNGPWDGVTKENKALALDVICTDVTKRMRTLGLKITLADAKNTLGINPEQSREIRNKFYDILIADHFTGKQETGDAHWKDLQQQWINNSQLLQDILAPGDTDPQHHQKLTAVNVLSRDVMKRLRDDQNRKNPAGKKQLNIGPGPGPANPKAKKNLDGAEVTPKRSPAKKGRPTGASTRWLATSSKADASARARTTPQAKKPPAPTSQKNNGSDLGQSQIDPSLLAAANDPSYAEQQLQDYAASASSPSHDLPFPYAPATQFPPQDSQAQQPSPKRSGPATAVWFRNAESSAALFGDPGKTWMGLLRDTSMHGLKQTALKNAQSYRINRIWGVVKDPDSGEEINMGLSSDAELSGYMEFLKDTDSTAAVFLVEVL